MLAPTVRAEPVEASPELDEGPFDKLRTNGNELPVMIHGCSITTDECQNAKGAASGPGRSLDLLRFHGTLIWPLRRPHPFGASDPGPGSAREPFALLAVGLVGFGLRGIRSGRGRRGDLPRGLP